MQTQRIAFFLPAMYGGGAEKVAINLLKGMADTVPLDLVLASAEGPYLAQVPAQVRIVNLAAGRVIKAIVPLSKYLRQYQPHALLSHLNHANVVAVLAQELARTNTRLVLVEHNTLSAAKSKLLRAKVVPLLMKQLYPRADAIIGVSQGVTNDLAKQLKIADKLKTIYNPVIDKQLITKSKEPLAHPWFQPDSIPVFVAVGRLTKQKDFPTLIRAFAILLQQKKARLLILGEGECRTELEMLINDLKLSECVSLPGFVENPYVYMRRASAFVLTSLWEGLPTVLIEAMACDCPVISTDCRSGPSEILASGKYGCLVPVGDVTALSLAMLQVLESGANLHQRARDFSIERIVPQYLEVLGLEQDGKPQRH